jgi:alkylhydroperoxidase family enzyme
MPFVETVPEARAAGAVAEMYAVDRESFGRLPNFASAFSLRPEVYGAWRQLNGAVKANMDLRRYELATVAAARRLRSSYCTLAHGSVLADKFLEPDAVRAVVEDYRSAGLAEADVAVMDLADNVPQAPRRRRRSGQDCVISLRARWCSMTNSLGGRRRPDRDHD